MWWRPGGYFSRPLLANPQFHRLFLARVRSVLDQVYTEQNYFPMIDAMVAAPQSGGGQPRAIRSCGSCWVVRSPAGVTLDKARSSARQPRTRGQASPAGRAGGPSPAAPGAPGTARPTDFRVTGSSRRSSAETGRTD